MFLHRDRISLDRIGCLVVEVMDNSLWINRTVKEKSVVYYSGLAFDVPVATRNFVPIERESWLAVISFSSSDQPITEFTGG